MSKLCFILFSLTYLRTLVAFSLVAEGNAAARLLSLS